MIYEDELDYIECPNCGEECKDEWIFCPWCGIKIDELVDNEN